MDVAKELHLDWHTTRKRGRDAQGRRSSSRTGLDGRLDRLLREAWSDALGSASRERELNGFVRGYRVHARLLGTRLGKSVAPSAASRGSHSYLLKD